MQSGKFRHVITVERPVTVQDETTGNEVTSWAPVEGWIRTRAEVLPDRASEYFGARQVQATKNAMIRTRFAGGLDPRMRVVFHVEPSVNEYWDIQGIIPFQERRRELRLMCLERDAEGWRRGTDLVNLGAPPDVPAGDVTADNAVLSGDSTLITADAA